MEDITVGEAIEITSGNMKYQYRIVGIFSLCHFSYSSYALGLAFMLSSNRSNNNATKFFDLYDEREYLQKIIISCYFMAIPIGALLFSWISDKYGRKKILEFTIFIYTIGSAMATIATSVKMLAVASFIMGFFAQNGLSGTYVILTEISPVKSRVILSSILFSSWSSGLIYSSLLYYFNINWRLNLCFLTVVVMAFYFLMAFVYESPRCLLTKNDVKQVQSVFEKISKINGKENFDYTLIHYKPFIQRSYSYLKLISKTNIKKTIIASLLWFNMNLIYYAILFINVSIDDNQYFNGFIMGCVEIVSMIFTGFIGNKFNRRALLFFSALLARVALVMIFIWKMMYGNSFMLVLFFAFSKIGVTFEYYSITLSTVESFPTTYRAMAGGFFNFVGRCGGLASSNLVYFAEALGISSTLFTVVISSFSIIGIYFMKETRNSVLKEMSDGEKSQSDELIALNKEIS
ncbi:hypothetical protein SteCoe_30197 [Stentor coeruleus]|uniref:Major facilitator superfamily (MFS) profile domain-containing protein n=1 Tax=Stentor coeruleus TaxID=5963 RepID=A0A1R2B487_9CILI|nr:hypothetical protein SteCoe_30197 [Stentor coeruleus]